MKNILAVMILLISWNVFAQSETEQQKLQKVTNQSIEYFNRQQYAQAIQLLESIKGTRQNFPSWYYYYALNLTHLQRYEPALKSFELYIRRTPGISDRARAYYYVGLIYFRQGNYEKALNNLELSLDSSQDPKLDSLTEALIDRTIRYQNYYENSKRSDLTFLLGYGYDSNVLNLAPALFPNKLSGHVLNYGASYSYKVVDKYNFVFAPTLAVIDMYTQNESFKSDSTLQAGDALQFLVSLPVRFYFDEGSLSNRYDFSLNAYEVHLPAATTKRELTITSFFLRGQVLTPFSTRYAARYNVTLAADKSHAHTIDEDDATGMRAEILATFVQYLADTGDDSIFYDLGMDYNGAKGVNSRYRRYLAGIGYLYPSFAATTSVLRAGYHFLEYPEKTEARRDKQFNLSYNINKDFGSGHALGFNLGAAFNESNIDLNDYSDYTAGLLYSKNFSW